GSRRHHRVGKAEDVREEYAVCIRKYIRKGSDGGVRLPYGPLSAISRELTVRPVHDRGRKVGYDQIGIRRAYVKAHERRVHRGQSIIYEIARVDINNLFGADASVV